jgi:Fe-S cluster assembly ATP-binding protein
MALLTVRDLHARVAGKDILKGIDLEVRPGEVHAIMGPNGSGKSTLASVLAGREGYEVTQGEVLFDGTPLLGLSPEDRATAGVFLAFQYPVEIPGVGNLHFLRTALNAQRRVRGLEELDAMDFLQLAREKSKLVQLDAAFMNRSVNEGFSGGEKKRNEIFQMAVLEPRLAILDETDSGLDIDALRTVAGGVNALRSPERGMVLITHYQRLLDYIVPDRVHVMAAGRIIRSGGRELALELEEKGYGWLGLEGGKTTTVVAKGGEVRR